MEPGPIATRVFLRTLSNDNAPRSMAICVESVVADTEAILQRSSDSILLMEGNVGSTPTGNVVAHHHKQKVGTNSISQESII